jgi:hypothetical protein
MAAKRKNDNRQNAHLLRYGILLSSMSLLAIFSILRVVGKLQAFVDIKENYCKVIGTSYATSTIKFNTSKEAGDDCFRVNTNTIVTTDTSIGKTIENDSAKTVSDKIDADKKYDEQNEKENVLNHNQQGKKLLEIAWLMSFPNSGTTYTNHLIQDYTNTTTATNYGQEQDTKKESVSVFPDSIDGPFFRYPSWSLPPRYLLTKTHCGGECDDCQTPGSKEYINTVEAFEKACCTGKRIFNNTKVRTTYSSDIPKRAVHLIRDPFDNIVARLHLKERRWGRHHNDTKYEERVDLFNKTKEGFRAYCGFRDIRSFKQEFRQRILSDELLGYAKQIPCYAQFISYTQWHNHAIQLVAKKSIPILTLFYEDYALDWDKTVNQILNFLSLTPAQGAKAEKFILGKHYDDFYNEEEKVAAMKLLQTLASTELWDMLQRYFP